MGNCLYYSLVQGWHELPPNPQCQTFGNFDWNTELFPDPQGFLDMAHNATPGGAYLSAN